MGRTRGEPVATRRVGSARRSLILVASLIIIGALTLVPDAAERWFHDFWCVRCGDGRALDVLLNVALFIPYGFGLRRAGWSVWAAMLTVCLTTISIEVLQYFFIVGRNGTVRDCLANAAGGMVGVAMHGYARHLMHPGRLSSRGLAWGAAALWIAHAAFATLLFRPLPTPYQYYGQLAPHLGQFSDFPGKVVRATLDHRPLLDGPQSMALTDIARSRDSIELSAEVIPGDSSLDLAPIVSVVDQQTNEIAMLGQYRDALVFRVRVQAQGVGLRSPVVALGSAFRGTARTRGAIVATGTFRASVLSARVSGAGAAPKEANVVLGPALGWALWWPYTSFNPTTLASLTWLWVALPMAAIAFWSVAGLRYEPWSWRSISRAVAPGVVATVGSHVVIPFVVMSVWRVDGAVMAATAAGLVAGWSIGVFDRAKGADRIANGW